MKYYIPNKYWTAWKVLAALQNWKISKIFGSNLVKMSHTG
jgi:hypothetical protein